MTTYLDCAATTPIDPRVAEAVVRYMTEEFGNAGSRTHEFGVQARRAVEQAREQVALAVGAGRGEVVFTSGATESCNLAILGLADYGLKTGKTHLLSTAIEHHAVLEPLNILKKRGFELTLVASTRGGWVDPQAVRGAVRDDTLLVSVMHVNNETGVIQPIEEIARSLEGHPAFLHIDAAQSFGKLIEPLRSKRIDLIGLSGHKIFAPKGIGALIVRRRGGERPPLTPLMFGGGQELGLRPGTLPVHLIVGLGLAAELAVAEAPTRARHNIRFRQHMLAALAPLSPTCAGDQDRVVPHIINLAFPKLDSQQAIEALAGIVAISSGAACTVQSYSCSHVLEAMRLNEEQMTGALRLSWCHMTEEPDWEKVIDAIRQPGP